MLSTLTASQPDTNERARNQQLCDENKALTEDNIKLKAAVSRLEARCTHVEHRKREYRAHCAEVEKSKQEMEQQAAILTQHRDRLHSENAELHDAVQKTLADQESLREQVLHYKKMISHTTRTEDQVSDEIIKDEAGQIYFHVQNFAVKYFRTARFSRSTLNTDLCFLRRLMCTQTTTLSQKLSRVGCVIMFPVRRRCRQTARSRSRAALS